MGGAGGQEPRARGLRAGAGSRRLEAGTWGLGAGGRERAGDPAAGARGPGTGVWGRAWDRSLGAKDRGSGGLGAEARGRGPGARKLGPGARGVGAGVLVGPGDSGPVDAPDDPSLGKWGLGIRPWALAA